MSGERILIVEDNAALRNAIQILLKSNDYTALMAATGVEALEAMTKEIPDLILADITMPGMDGYDLFESVRANPKWRLIPFVFLTARADREDILRGKALGVEDYLVKPLDTEELLTVVRAKLDRTEIMRTTKDLEIRQITEQIALAFSHELRTPLTWIIAYTELAMGYLNALPPDQVHEFLEHVLQGGERITRVTDDLLTLIRLDAGELRDRLQEVLTPCRDVSAVVQRTVDQYEPAASVKGIRLQASACTPLPPVLLCEEFLSDALGRLIDNAIKFTRDEDTEVAVTTKAGNGTVSISVADQGIGIAPEDMPLLFDRFRQINRDRVEQQGLGLGLAIARELVTLHEGEIGVQSAPGSGSTFTIQLPVLSAEDRSSRGS